MDGIKYFGKTDVGRQRKDNQDRFVACDISFMNENAVLLAAIDGVGGYAGGDIAAEITAESLKNYLDGYSVATPEIGIEEAMVIANNRIVDDSMVNSETNQKGCVASVCVIDQSFVLHYSHVGDTRIYIYSNGQLEKITHDHSVVGPMEEFGELTEEQAMSHPDRNVICKMLGCDRIRLNNGFVEHGTYPITKSCQILLCSDGLTDQVLSTEIKEILDKDISPEEKAEALINLANNKGGKDNVTVCVCEVKSHGKEIEEPVDLFEKQNKTLKSNIMKNTNNGVSLFLMLLVSVSFLFGFHILHKNQSPMLENASRSFKEGRAICLNREIPEQNLSSMLEKAGYYTDEKDAHCVSHHIAAVLADKKYSIQKLFDLRTWDYQIPVDQARNYGGHILTELADSSCKRIGISPDIIKIYETDSIPSYNNSGNSLIQVRVVDYEDKRPVPGVVVRLKEHFYECEQDNIEVAKDSILAYSMTDSIGYACFRVNKGRSYSVLPIKPGFQYGKEKGTVKGSLNSTKAKYSFEEREHRINFFPGKTYSDIKNSMSLTVRTPEEYSGKMLASIVLFLLSWWVAFIAVSLRDKKVKLSSEKIIIPVLMFISGVGLLAQFSMLNPLVDRVIGFDTSLTITIAICVFIILQRIEIVRWYASDYWISRKHRILFDPVNGSTYRPLGVFYIILAIGIMLLLAIAGTSPEGSDAKISLFGWFQPVDLCKFLIVIFMAAFFTSREDEIRMFSSVTNKVSFRLQLRVIALVCIFVIIVCGLYLSVLSDMGSGLICLLVFIFMYSCARKDIGMMVLGISSYIALILITRSFTTDIQTLILFSIVWLVLWLAINLIIRKAVFESAIFFNLLIFILIAGGPIMKSIPLTEHQGAKLMERTAMTFSGVWSNEIDGGVGDQIFLAVKSISSGGLLGQGLAKGHPNFTPAFTTDMIIAGISEQMGYSMIIALMIAYVILAYFSLKSAMKCGHKFVFYLVYGIILATVIQWFILMGSTLGVFCLTGTPASFLSFGKSSLLFHIIAYSLVISASRYPYGQFSVINRDIISNRMSSFPICIIVSLALLGYGLRFSCFEREKTITRPGYFIDKDGNMIVEYDPRISKILDNIEAGNIYDRNGILLATSSRDELLANKDQYLRCGVTECELNKEIELNQRRYYPFGPGMSFTLGDYNDKHLWSNSKTSPYGLGIENRYFSHLRGFDDTMMDMYGNPTRKTFKYYKKCGDRFLPEKRYEVKTTMPIYDYSPIVELIKEDGDGERTRNWNNERQNRDITITSDARLQNILQLRMAEFIAKDEVLSSKNKLIGAVFIQEVNTGDMLASANYPLPQADTILFLNKEKIYRNDETNPQTKAISMYDGGFTQTPCGSVGKPMTALAGMMAQGDAVCNKSYYVYPEEIIERGKIKEPNGHYINFIEAVRQSSNCYFNFFGLDNNVFKELGNLYKTVGVRLDGHDKRGKLIPYVFETNEMSPELEVLYDKEIAYVQDKAMPLYSSYIKLRNEDGKRTRLNAFRGSAEWWGWFYGQSSMSASPCNLARVCSIIAGNGSYVPTRYILKLGADDIPTSEPITVVPTGTRPLLEAMASEADKHRANGYKLPNAIDGIGDFFSKTGTPERGLYTKDHTGKLVYSKPNDGWYIFGVPCASTNSYLAVAIRLERLGAEGSPLAVKFASEVVLPAIKECGYQIDF